MKKQGIIIISIILLLSIGVASVGVVKAEERDFTLPWSVISSGGMGGSAGGYTINSTLGQPVAGTADEGTIHLTSGFWTEIIESIEEFFNFLPLIMR